MTHTPEPWHINPSDITSKYGNDIGIFAKVGTHQNPRWICRVYDGAGTHGRTPESLANARLIKASPTLLANLKATLTALKAHIVEASKAHAIDPATYCPCLDNEVATAEALIKELTP